jgi:hypothetical protein
MVCPSIDLNISLTETFRLLWSAPILKLFIIDLICSTSDFSLFISVSWSAVSLP